MQAGHWGEERLIGSRIMVIRVPAQSHRWLEGGSMSPRWVDSAQRGVQSHPFSFQAVVFTPVPLVLLPDSVNASE